MDIKFSDGIENPKRFHAVDLMKYLLISKI